MSVSLARMGWVVGRNLAGYKPESDVTVYLTLEDAKAGLADEMRYYAEEDDEEEISAGYDRDEETYPTMGAHAAAIIRDEIECAHDFTGDRTFYLEDGRGRLIAFRVTRQEISYDDYREALYR